MSINSNYQSLIQLLSDKSVKYQYIEHKECATADEYHEVLGTKYEEQAKALFLKYKTEGQKHYLVFAIPAQKKADLKSVAKILNVKEVKMATKEELLEVTGCNFGELTPIASLFGLKLLLDEDFLGLENIYFNAFRLDGSIKMNPSDLSLTEDIIKYSHTAISEPDEVDSSLDIKRHSFAHLMAAAVLKMFPEAQMGVGPVIENGCYYDFVLPRNLIPEDLPLIESHVKDFLKRDLRYKRQELSMEEALSYFADSNQPLKVELLENLRDNGTTSLSEEEKADFGSGQTPVISMYRIVDEKTGEVLFTDLCRGPHVFGTRKSSEETLNNPFETAPKTEGFNLQNLGFKLDKFSASYWRGDQARGINMQRLYGLIFETKEELKEFVTQREEAKKRDHRVLNVTQKYFTISELVGAGLPLFQPNGMVLRKSIQNYLWQLHSKKGYKEVWTPHIAKEDLYITSGHAAKFGDELFRVQGKTESFFMKPMNCPHHMQIFADNQFSYRDMPVRYFEHATVYRDEKPGQLSGFTRVRSITQDDGHLFCRVGQIKAEVSTIVGIIREFYDTIGMEASWVSLSVRDMNDLGKYLGGNEVWDLAEKSLEEAANENNLNYKRVEGEAAFYGPKLDFMFKDCMGREWQLATIQCDFNLPEKFDLSFVNENSEKERPVVIHRAIAGSSERFLGVIIDNFAGKFPFWLSPEQIRILTINDTVLDYVAKIKEVLDNTVLSKPLKYNEIRYSVDDRMESLGKKIREAKLAKTPMLIVIGEQDKIDNVVSIEYGGESVKVGLGELEGWLLGVK
jgi:threonyl-tRNA synthetase